MNIAFTVWNVMLKKLFYNYIKCHKLFYNLYILKFINPLDDDLIKQ